MIIEQVSMASGLRCKSLSQETAYKLRQSLRFHQLLLADIWQAKWSAEDPSLCFSKVCTKIILFRTSPC